jgi:D-alanyl-D-alanine carboxypeptidase
MATAEPSMARSVDGALAGRLTTALEAGLADAGAPGAQAAVVFADGSLWTGAAGLSTADLPMNPELLMAIGSVTKVYTAALTLELAGQGILSIDEPLTTYVPDAVNADGVTIRRLLLHTSGIASDDPALPPVCRPGTCLSYSNSGYGYLGAAIESATGGDYARALRDRILGPLGLKSTFFPRQEAIDGELATSGGPEVHGASGGIVATAADTARFVHALFTGSLVNDHALDAMLDFDATHGLPGADDCIAQAMVYRRAGEFGESWNHGGNSGFFRSWAEHYPRYAVTTRTPYRWASSMSLPVRRSMGRRRSRTRVTEAANAKRTWPCALPTGPCARSRPRAGLTACLPGRQTAGRSSGSATTTARTTSSPATSWVQRSFSSPTTRRRMSFRAGRRTGRRSPSHRIAMGITRSI